MAINDTINQTIETGILGEITFDKWIEISTSLPFIIGVVAIVLVPFLLYIIIGVLTKARTSEGMKLESSMIQNPNFWIAPIIWTLFQSAIITIWLLYPFWLKWL